MTPSANRPQPGTCEPRPTSTDTDMKYLALIFALATVALIHSAEGKVDKEKKQAMIKKCKAETKASDSDVELAEKHGVPETKEGKCFIACGFNHYGMMKDSKVNLEGVNNFFEKSLEKQEHKDRAIKVAAACAATEDVKGLDECETAAKYMKCVKTHPDFADILPILTV